MGQYSVLPLVLFWVVAKSPSVGGEVPPMVILLLFVDFVTSDYFLRWRQTNSLWIYYGLNFLSLLHFITYGVSRG